MRTSSNRGGRRWLFVAVVVGLLGGYAYYSLTRSITLVSPVTSIGKSQVGPTASKLDWPATSQGAVGILDSSILETHGTQTPAPIASVAKVITALTVLEKYPLQKGEKGPEITLTEADVALYNSYAAQDGSVVKVQAGEKITEYQMLQAIMLPSANNLADSLAIWAYGSLPGYTSAANNYLSKNRLNATRVGVDASGLSPVSVSTANDLARLGELAMENPVLAEIANQSTVNDFPVVGTIKNVNFLLGESGIVGVKTGNTDQAGGVFVGASKVVINNKPVTIVTSVVGAQSLFSAMKESLVLTKSAQANFKIVAITQAGAIVGTYKLPWGGTAQVASSKELSVKTWGGNKPTVVLKLDDIPSSAQGGTTVGSVSVGNSATSAAQSVPATLEESIPQPSVLWRLTHPF